jgi:putative glutamine amidotransferase
MNTPHTPPSVRIGIYGNEVAPGGRGVGLWQAGYKNTLTAAGAAPVYIPRDAEGTWEEILDGVQGLVLTSGKPLSEQRIGDEESLCLWCRDHRFPLLAVDDGLLALNAVLGGTNYQDLPKELPEALQHRHPPEHGLRHAIMVESGTMLAGLYGEGEIVVNSEHRQAICRVAKGFRVSACALDGVIEAVESQDPNWWVLGVQWQPASDTASGLDIQVFRGLVDASAKRTAKPASKSGTRRLAGVA